MTRTEKLRKLANAIKDYRGSYHPASGKWIRPPQPAKLDRIAHWFARLGMDWTPELVARIDGFKTKDEFIVFLNELEQPTN